MELSLDEELCDALPDGDGSGACGGVVVVSVPDVEGDGSLSVVDEEEEPVPVSEVDDEVEPVPVSEVELESVVVVVLLDELAVVEEPVVVVVLDDAVVVVDELVVVVVDEPVVVVVLDDVDGDDEVADPLEEDGDVDVVELLPCGGGGGGGGGDEPLVGGPCDVCVAEDRIVTVAVEISEPSLTVKTVGNAPMDVYVCSTATGRPLPFRGSVPSP